MTPVYMTDVAYLTELIQRAVEGLKKEGKPHTLDDAARYVLARVPELCFKVMDQIGSYPSSERELAAIQRHWGPR